VTSFEDVRVQKFSVLFAKMGHCIAPV